MKCRDRFDRYVSAQAPVYDQVLCELRQGRKTSHWMWFIFPQLRGLGHSVTSRRYAITSLKDAGAFLGHKVLGPRLRQCTELVLALNGRDIQEVFGYVDALKFHSCITLFALCEEHESVFTQALDAFYDGAQDESTLRLLKERHEYPDRTGTVSLVIQTIEAGHAAAIQKLASEAAVAATTTIPHPYPPDGASKWIADCVARREAGSDYSFAVLANDIVIGVVSLLKIRDGIGEIGYWIGKPYWGSGYAAAAGRLLLEFGFKALGLKKIRGRCLESNRASFRTLEKLGFKCQGTQVGPHPKSGESVPFAYFELDSGGRK